MGRDGEGRFIGSAEIAGGGRDPRRARSALLLASALGCSLSVFVAFAPSQALAANDCGAVTKNNSPGQDLVVCSATTGTGNPYAAGINYNENTTGLPVNDLTVALAGGGSLSAAQVNTVLTGVTVQGALNHSASVNTNAGATVIAGQDGISVATSGSGVAAINNVAAVSAYDRGLFAYNPGAGGVTVVNSGVLTLGSGGAAPISIGIAGNSANGAVNVNNSGAINVTTTDPIAVGVRGYSNNAVTITNSAPITVSGAGSAIGIQATYNTSGTAISVTSTANVSATTSGATSKASGIEAGNTTNVAASSYVGLTNANATGAGYNAAGVTTRATGNVQVYGNGTSVITANRTGTANVNGNAAVYAFSVNGASTVNVNKAVATGAYNQGIYAWGSGNVTVVANTVTTSGVNSTGVNAYSNSGYAQVSVGGVSTTGANSTGLEVYGYTGAKVSAVNVTTQGANSNGVSVATYAGTTTVTATSVTTQGANSTGISVKSGGSGPMTVNVGGIAGSTVYGVTTHGDNSAGVNAVLHGANSAGGSQLKVNNKGFIQTYGAHSAGAQAYANYGHVTVTSVAGTTVHTRGDYSNGLTAYAKYGQATVSNAGAVTTGGKASIGLYAHTYTDTPFPSAKYTASVVNTGTVNTSGFGASGEVAISTGNANITVGTVTTTGQSAVGADAKSTYGTATIVGGVTSTSGSGAVGLRARGQYGATITTGNVTTANANATGVYAYALHGAATIHISGPISTSGTGSVGALASTDAFNNATASIDGAGAVTTTASNSSGVIAAGYGGAAVNITGNVSATGSGSHGVAAYAFNGAATVTVKNVTASSTAVEASSFNYAAGVTVNGTVASTAGVGVVARSYYSMSSVAVAHGASVSAVKDSVDAFSYTGSTVTNHGAVATNSPATNFAVSASATHSGAVSLTNASDGVITGPVSLSGKAGTTFTNAGVWNASNVSNVGSAAVGGVVANSGVVNVAPTASAPATVGVTNLASWNNSGLINTVNGHTGDVLNLGNATFTGSGSSALNVDAFLAGPVSTDKLVIGAAAGSTVINVHDLAASTPGQIDFVGATVVQGTSGSAANFTLAGQPIHKGFVDYALYFNASAVTWNLVGLPNHAVFETLKVPALAQAFGDHTNQVWDWRMQEVRDARAMGDRKDGFELWGQIYGGSQNVDRTQAFSFSQFAFSENLSTHSRWGGVQVGIDHLSDWKGGKLLWGFTAGYLEQWSSFATGADTITWATGQVTEPTLAGDSVRMHGANLGGYIGWAKGGWFVNGLAKADFAATDLRMNSVTLNTTTNATVWGLRGELGYRWAGRGMFIEPVVKVSGGDTNVDSWNGAGATGTYPDNSSLQVQAGARVGGQVASSAAFSLTPYLGAYVVDETAAQNREFFSTGGPANTITLKDVTPRSFARIDLGATAKSNTGIEGFVKATVDTGEGVTGWTANLGLRWRW